MEGMAPATPSRKGGAPTLSDAQVERYSRQIVLREIGGAGQARLLATSVLLLGGGPLAEMAALYLAGAGIGRIALFQATDSLADAVRDLNPDVAVEHGAAVDATYDVVVACDAEPAAIARAATGRTIIAAGLSDAGGWLVIAAPGGACASCVALRHAGQQHAACPELVSVAAGVLGSLITLEVLKRRLGRGSPPAGELHFDVVQSTLSEHPIAHHADCAVCKRS